MGKWRLYVLRYAYSGNYYVGTTSDLKKRMLVHWRRTSTKNNLPICSYENKSTKGFICYWFNIAGNGVSQAIAEHYENDLAKLIIDKIETVNKQEFIRETHVGNGKCVDGKEKNHGIEVKVKNPNIDLIDIEIKKMLNTPRLLELEAKNKYPIGCFKIGNVQKYHRSDCKKNWWQVVAVGFPDDNKARGDSCDE